MGVVLILALNRHSALRALRTIRRGEATGVSSRIGRLPRSQLLELQLPEGRQRWTRSCLDLSFLGLRTRFTKANPINVATTVNATRMQASFATCTIYSTGLPRNAFLDVGNGIFVASPELIFLEMATVLKPFELLLLGYELVGSYAPVPSGPPGGESGTAYGLQPATTLAKLRRFLEGCSRIPGLPRAKETLRFIRENAWSPREALIAALAVLPAKRGGYEVGEVVLNPRSYATQDLIDHGARESRVPDVLLASTPVGLNYEGDEHLELGAIVKCATAMALNPGDAFCARRLEEAVRTARARFLDDLRRNRELAAMGKVVTSVTKEDLARAGGLDAVMLLAVATIERIFGKEMLRTRRAIASRKLADLRQALIDRAFSAVIE